MAPKSFSPTELENESDIVVTKNKVVFAKRGAKKKTSKNKRDAIRKPSVNDSKKSTILLVEQNNDVGASVKSFAETQKKEKKITFHPIMAVMLDENRNPSKYYAYIDHLYMEATKFKELLSCYLQSFHVYNLEYPSEGKLVCEFLAELFFKFDSGKAEISTFIKDMEEELKLKEHNDSLVIDNFE